MVNFSVLNSMLLVWHPVDVFCCGYGPGHFNILPEMPYKGQDPPVKGWARMGAQSRGRELA